MYENMTFDSIMQRMLDAVPDTIDKREGSVVYDALAPAAIELQNLYIELDVVLNQTFVDTATGEITGLYTGMTDEDSYALNGAQQISTFCAIDGKSYYFDGNGNMLKGTAANALVVYIKSATEGAAGMAWSFDADGVATAVNNSWVYVLGEDGNLSTANKGYYFDSNKGLAYGLQDSSIVVGDIYIFDDNGYLYVNVASHDYNGVIYVIDENGKAKAKDEDEE